ncbi:cobalamin biosynthesis protein CobD [Marinilabiliaceae bacterium JC017]|nr:cobalamin biosynthesis protein CobD [Marinilabiliaceae bacterium JC017]
MENSDIYTLIAITLAYVADLLLGDPYRLPHPVVTFGKAISKGEKQLNNGRHRRLKGALMTMLLITFTYFFFLALMQLVSIIHPLLQAGITALFFFFGLANQTLIKEGRAVFRVLERKGTEAGRNQLSRIVGRDTSSLSPQQVKTAVLETMAENLSDGVVAPIFWFIIGGIPGMMTYKMINTLDSMIGYKNDRYRQFGTVAARIDDLANYIPARLTALLMALPALSARAFQYIFRFGHAHCSPNAGYPEAALAGILNCRFGGPNTYYGELVKKPYIGLHHRKINQDDIKTTTRINHTVCFLSIALTLLITYSLR